MALFRRTSVRYGRTPEPETPYQRAAQAWDDRIGSARVQARNWRIMAFGCLGLSIGQAGGLVWQAARGSIVPWVVQVDKAGQAEAVAPAAADYRPTDPQIAWYLANFIQDVRSLPDDPIVLRQHWLQAYNFTTTSGAQALNEYARADHPFAALGHEQISVDISSVIRASPDSFQVDWVEHHYKNGGLSSVQSWSAILTVTLQPPHSAAALRKNPLGIYVTAINWSKELGQ